MKKLLCVLMLVSACASTAKITKKAPGDCIKFMEMVETTVFYLRLEPTVLAANTKVMECVNGHLFFTIKITSISEGGAVKTVEFDDEMFYAEDGEITVKSHKIREIESYDMKNSAKGGTE